MAKKISQLTQATQVKSDDVTVIVQDGETKKLPLNMMVTKQDIENKKVAGLAKLDEIEATYENDTYTPTITVKNKSSVKVGEGDGVDYSANVMDGHAKSAILKGQTLVNIFPHLQNDNYLVDGTNSVIIDENIYKVYHSTTANYSIRLKTDVFATKMKSNTDYTLIINIIESTITKTGVKLGISTHENLSCIDATNIIGTARVDLGNTVGFFKEKVRLKDDLRSTRISDIYFCFWDGTGNDTEYVKFKVMLLEGDYTNVDIPYFEGMQSVKMPVLTTTGKNLFDFKNAQWLKGGNFNPTYGNSGNIVIENMSLKLSNPSSCVGTIVDGLKPNTEYYISANITNTSTMVINSGLSYVVNNTTIDGGINRKRTTNSNGELAISIGVYNANTNGGYVLVENIQVEEGSTATSYEPFKTNILSVSEDIKLRGIGDVRDELNLLTGEVTERIGEIVLDGSESWIIHSNTHEESVIFRLPLSAQQTSLCLTDKFNTIIGTVAFVNGVEAMKLDPSGLSVYINILKSRLSSTDVNGLKQWLHSNPVTLQYPLATESVKTVDLIPSGTHPSTTPYCWKDGHIQLSSSGLLPSLEYSVVTSRAGQISQNAAMIVKNDKRIFDLEILLAGGLVNTTYQALTLQNQVETGLSKVSLNSEKEPDYLLYHMIMKLIEKKAYKLDDLAEKVSVFYLYEKLSDEQFETIYSELYPFVEEEYIELPEDGEIIEEPIVDEVLEEVENGVVM